VDDPGLAPRSHAFFYSGELTRGIIKPKYPPRSWVRPMLGPGTLLQVFAERVTVLLDSELCRCRFFEPAEIEPVSRGLP
jgi:hypothetical protein